MKKFFHHSTRRFLLAIFALCLLFPAKAQEFISGGIGYYVTDSYNMTAEVAYLDGEFNNVVEIPSVVTAMVYPMYEEPYEATLTITGIGSYAFRNNSQLTEVILPNTIEYIGYSAFYECIALNKINLPNSLKTIGGNAFAYTALESVEIPQSVTSLDWNVFYSCTSLTSVTLPNSITFLGGTFAWCKSLKNVNIPNSVTTIYDAFRGCSSLSSIIIPNSVVDISNNAFNQCDALTDITCLAQTPPTISNSSCFYSQLFDIYNTATLKVPMPSVSAYQTANVWKLFSHITGINEAEQGDVDGDGRVTIADVTELVDLLLNGTGDSNPVADVDGDGRVTIADVTELIDILLSGN